MYLGRRNAKERTMTTKLEKATLALEDLLSARWEWPDATARVCSKFNVDMDELTESYDNLQAERGLDAWDAIVKGEY